MDLGSHVLMHIALHKGVSYLDRIHLGESTNYEGLFFLYLRVYSYSDDKTIHTFSRLTTVYISHVISYQDIPTKYIGTSLI
jgi:hypothetical protein